MEHGRRCGDGLAASSVGGEASNLGAEEAQERYGEELLLRFAVVENRGKRGAKEGVRSRGPGSRCQVVISWIMHLLIPNPTSLHSRLHDF